MKKIKFFGILLCGIWILFFLLKKINENKREERESLCKNQDSKVKVQKQINKLGIRPNKITRTAREHKI